jgi:hypothetical protein
MPTDDHVNAGGYFRYREISADIAATLLRLFAAYIAITPPEPSRRAAASASKLHGRHADRTLRSSVARREASLFAAP